LDRLIRERPISAVLLDSADLLSARVTDPTQPVRNLERIRRGYPSVGIVLLARHNVPLEMLHRVGQARVANLRLVRIAEIPWRLETELEHALHWSAASRVTQALASWVRRSELRVVRSALESLHYRPSADQFAQSLGAHRPQLSAKLRASGLPSVGHLLLWGRLFQGAIWLVEPGRTADSVARQLEYSDGAAFRRALRHRTGATPTQVIREGGLPFLLSCFRDACEVASERLLVRAS